MKQVCFDRIIHVPGTDLFDNLYEFTIATKVESPFMVDISKDLSFKKNENIDYRRDYKLWNSVYPVDAELEIFEAVVSTALRENKKIHITGLTLREEIEVIRSLYMDLGYFDEKENRFIVPFTETPITVGVNIKNLIYSTKDYKSKREEICFLPPPREPGHVKSLFAWINSGVVSTLTVDDFLLEKESLQLLLDLEKTNLTILSGLFSHNAWAIGIQVLESEKWIVKI